MNGGGGDKMRYVALFRWKGLQKMKTQFLHRKSCKNLLKFLVLSLQTIVKML